MRLLSLLLLAGAAFAQGGAWTDLPLDPQFSQWTRISIPPGKAPSEPSQWKLGPDGTVICEGNGGHDMLRYNRELKDFVLHAEWRFTKLEGEPRYNSGVFVRNDAEGVIWHQAQAGLAGAFLFGNTLVNGSPQRFNLRQQMTENRVKPAGEWNVFEITCAGPKISLSVNGKVVSEYETGVLTGYIGLEAEGYRIEFRNLKLRAL